MQADDDKEDVAKLLPKAVREGDYKKTAELLALHANPALPMPDGIGFGNGPTPIKIAFDKINPLLTTLASAGFDEQKQFSQVIAKTPILQELPTTEAKLTNAYVVQDSFRLLYIDQQGHRQNLDRSSAVLSRFTTEWQSSFDAHLEWLKSPVIMASRTHLLTRFFLDLDSDTGISGLPSSRDKALFSQSETAASAQAAVKCLKSLLESGASFIGEFPALACTQDDLWKYQFEEQPEAEWIQSLVPDAKAREKRRAILHSINNLFRRTPEEGRGDDLLEHCKEVVEHYLPDSKKRVFLEMLESDSLSQNEKNIYILLREIDQLTFLIRGCEAVQKFLYAQEDIRLLTRRGSLKNSGLKVSVATGVIGLVLFIIYVALSFKKADSTLNPLLFSAIGLLLVAAALAIAHRSGYCDLNEGPDYVGKGCPLYKLSSGNLASLRGVLTKLKDEYAHSSLPSTCSHLLLQIDQRTDCSTTSTGDIFKDDIISVLQTAKSIDVGQLFACAYTGNDQLKIRSLARLEEPLPAPSDEPVPSAHSRASSPHRKLSVLVGSRSTSPAPASSREARLTDPLLSTFT